MLMLQALRNRSISLLWSGQALSSIGDEIYRVALIWMAVGLIGNDSGYVAAGQCAALLLLSLIGGKWTDHRDPLSTMIRTDVSRALIVLIPVIASYFIPLNLILLLAVALALSGLGAFFDPALQSSLPTFTTDAKNLKAATGLMSTTMRLARVAGPSIVGFLSAIIPTIHFFTLDSLSFFISAFSISRLAKKNPEASLILKRNITDVKRQTFVEALASGFYAVRSRQGMGFVLAAKAVTGGTWNLAYTLGFALLVQSMTQHNVRAFGSVIASYGIGNLAGALYFGNSQRVDSRKLMFSGYAWLGIGWLLVAAAPNILFVMCAACFCGFGGPMNDLPFTDLVQSTYSVTEMVKVFRFRTAAETGATLLCTLASPLLLKLISVRSMISACGVIALTMGLWGLIKKDEIRPHELIN